MAFIGLFLSFIVVVDVIDYIKSIRLLTKDFLVLGLNHLDLVDVVEEPENSARTTEFLDIPLGELLGGNVADTPITILIDKDPHRLFRRIHPTNGLDETVLIEFTLRRSGQVLEVGVLEGQHILEPLAALVNLTRCMVSCIGRELFSDENEVCIHVGCVCLGLTIKLYQALTPFSKLIFSNDKSSLSDSLVVE